MSQSDDGREERQRKLVGEMAMACLDITNADYLRLVDAASDALEELAVYMREGGYTAEMVGAALGGLVGALIVDL